MQNDKPKPRVAVREDLFTNELEWALGKFSQSLARAGAGAQNKFPVGHTPGSQFFFQVISFFYRKQERKYVVA